MSGALGWRDGPVTSRDPYGQWAGAEGLDFLIDYKSDLKDAAGKPHAYAVIRPDPAEPPGTDEPPAARRRDRTLALGLSAGDPGTDAADPLALTVPLALRRDSLPAGMTGAVRLEPGLDGEEVDPIRLPSGVELADEDTILCVIDHGTVVTHEAFLRQQDPPKTRVLWAWMQEGRHEEASRLPFGRALDADALDAILADAPDPETAMRRAGLADPRRDQEPTALARASHGTAVAALAGGTDGPSGGPSAGTGRIWILSVGLPSFANWDHAGLGLSVFVTFAMRQILRKVLRLLETQKRPGIRVVLNLSYGISGGPHDGTGLFEAHIDALMARYKQAFRARLGQDARVALMLPAGNGFHARRHARAQPAESGRTSLHLPWRVGPSDRTSSFVEAWLPMTAEDVEITVTTPGGMAESWTPPAVEDAPGRAVAARLLLRGGSVIARLSYDVPLFAHGHRRVVLALAPTDTAAASAPRRPAMAGCWGLTVSARLPAQETIRAWIQREEQTFGLKQRGGLGYFDDPAYRRFTPAGALVETDSGASCVRRFGTMNGMATGAETLVAGAFRRTSLRASDYSAAAEPGRDGPDLLVDTDHSRYAPGHLTASNRARGGAVLGGTSASAALATRHLLDLERWEDGDAARQIRRDAAKSEADLPEPPCPSPLPGTGGPIPPARGGQGRLLRDADRR